METFVYMRDFSRTVLKPWIRGTERGCCAHQGPRQWMELDDYIPQSGYLNWQFQQSNLLDLKHRICVP